MTGVQIDSYTENPNARAPASSRSSLAHQQDDPEESQKPNKMHFVGAPAVKAVVVLIISVSG